MDKDFERQFNKAVAEIDVKINKAVRAGALELFSAIIKGTPVGQPSLWQSDAPRGYTGGSLRGNWQTSIGSPITTEIDQKDSNGSSTIGKAASVLNNANIADQTIYFTNNLPYADRVRS